jgi:hypothetical protein
MAAENGTPPTLGPVIRWSSPADGTLSTAIVPPAGHDLYITEITISGQTVPLVGAVYIQNGQSLTIRTEAVKPGILPL